MKQVCCVLFILLAFSLRGESESHLGGSEKSNVALILRNLIDGRPSNKFWKIKKRKKYSETGQDYENNESSTEGIIFVDTSPLTPEKTTSEMYSRHLRVTLETQRLVTFETFDQSDDLIQKDLPTYIPTHLPT